MSNIVNLAELPLELLEQIVSKLDPEEIISSVSQISQRFSEVSYNVLCKEFRALAPMIDKQLNHAKGKLNRIHNARYTFENEMIEVSNFTLYQILQSEYKVVCTIYFMQKSLDHTPLVFLSVRSLKEFAKLLLTPNEVNLNEGNVCSVLDMVRSCNTELLQCFFCDIWDPKLDYMGLMILKFLNCSLCSSYEVTVSYEKSPKFKNSKCHITGSYEITDLSNILNSPPQGLQEMEIDKAKKALAFYICETIRSGNLFHTLRLRWICMDRALAMGRGQSTGSSITDPLHQYTTPNSERDSVQETEQILRNGDIKIIRKIIKAPDPTYSQTPSWMGTKVEFQLWCRANEAPAELFSKEYWTALQDLPGAVGADDPACTWPFHFKMEYKTYARSITTQGGQAQGLIETTVWVKENPDTTTITQSKQLLI